MDSPQRMISETSEQARAAADSADRAAAAGRGPGGSGSGDAGARDFADRAWEVALDAAQAVDDIVHRHPYAALAASVAVGAASGARRRRRRWRGDAAQVAAVARPRSLMRSMVGQAASLVATEALRIAAGYVADQRGAGAAADRGEGAVGEGDAGGVPDGLAAAPSPAQRSAPPAERTAINRY